MIVGFEWLIDALDCDENSLRDVETLRGVFARIVEDLQLKTIGDGAWHKFDGEGGVTGLVMLTESHLACHTYPEHKSATFNLYCCRTRPEWNWEENLKSILGAKTIVIEKLERGSGQSQFSILKAKLDQLETKISTTEEKIFESEAKLDFLEWEILDQKSETNNPKSKIAGGEH